jgi:hypothetical protein
VCPSECSCNGDIVKDCYPIIQPGAVSGNPAVDGTISVQSITPFSLLQLIPCPRTSSGLSLCNADGLRWTAFYQIGGAEFSSQQAPSGFCFPGHESRLCAACSANYFSSGRSCEACLSPGVHVIIVCCNLLVLAALVTYLWRQSSKTEGSHPDVHMASESKESNTSNPLRLLVFHTQQLSLLLFTTSLPPGTMTGLIAVLGAGGTGFSLSSLTAMECLASAWSMQHRCWLALIAPLLVGAAAATTWVYSRWSHSRGVDPFVMERRAILKDPLVAGVDSTGTAANRVYSVCVSLMYLLVFPCAQTALSALGCTDWREAGADAGPGMPSRVYLNLFPWQQCDAQWREEILPPALLASLLWCVAFPVASTWLLHRTHSRRVDSNDSSVLSLSFVSDLLQPYSSRWWFFEQVLLLRRLLLVACVCFVQAYSLYTPLLLLTLIQLSALLQQYAQPYRSRWLNHGELASLFLLLITYLSALVLQSSNSSPASSESGWFVVLFLSHVLFMLLLLLGLFAYVRVKFGPRLWVIVSRTRCAIMIHSALKVQPSSDTVEQDWNLLTPVEVNAEASI